MRNKRYICICEKWVVRAKPERTEGKERRGPEETDQFFFATKNNFFQFFHHSSFHPPVSGLPHASLPFAANPFG